MKDKGLFLSGFSHEHQFRECIHLGLCIFAPTHIIVYVGRLNSNSFYYLIFINSIKNNF